MRAEEDVLDLITALCRDVGIVEHDIFILPYTLAIQACLTQLMQVRMARVPTDGFSEGEIEQIFRAKGVTRLVIPVIQELPLDNLDVTQACDWIASGPRTTREVVLATTVSRSKAFILSLRRQLATLRPGERQMQSCLQNGANLLVHPIRAYDSVCAIHIERT